MMDEKLKKIEKKAVSLQNITASIPESDQLTPQEVQRVISLGEKIQKICNWDSDPEIQKQIKMDKSMIALFTNPDKTDVKSKMIEILKESGEEIDEEGLEEIEGLAEQMKALEGISVEENDPIFFGGPKGTLSDQLETIIREIANFKRRKIDNKYVNKLVTNIETLALTIHKNIDPDNSILKL